LIVSYNRYKFRRRMIAATTQAMFLVPKLFNFATKTTVLDSSNKIIITRIALPTNRSNF